MGNQVALMRREAKVGLVCRAAAPSAQLKRINVPGADIDGLPRSSVTVSGGLAYTSGFYGTGPGDIALDTKKAMDQVRAALEAARSSMDNAVYCEVDVADLSDVPAIDAVYRTYFKKAFPARQVVQVVGPAPAAGAKMSIMCIGSTA